MSIDLLCIVAGALAAGLISGPAGFGTASASSAFWLSVLGPAVVSPLLLAVSGIGLLIPG